MMSHEIRNSLTDIDSGYKQVSQILMLCISGLGKYCPLVHNIFSRIIYNKFYGSGARTVSAFEEKRIYNNIPVTIDSILMDINPGKYNNGDVSTDISNYKKKLNFLHESNILYLWSYLGKYIFFLERDFGLWKYYNCKGVVIPKTIYKVSNVGLGAIDCMVASEDKSKNGSDRHKIELSFARFLSGMIDKMESSVSKKLPRFVIGKDVNEYIEEIKMKSAKLYEYEGLFEDIGFESRLPITVRESLSMKKKVNESDSEMEKLVPKEINLCKNKATEKKKEKYSVSKALIKKSNNTGSQAEVADVSNFKGDGGVIDPFKDSTTFSKHYHSYLTAFCGGVALRPLQLDIVDSGKILDHLTDIGKKGDMFFLKAWLDGFCKELRKKGRTKNKKYTSINYFGDTLVDFKKEFYDPRQLL